MPDVHTILSLSTCISSCVQGARVEIIVLCPSSPQSTCALTVMWECLNRDPCQQFVVSIVESLLLE